MNRSRGVKIMLLLLSFAVLSFYAASGVMAAETPLKSTDCVKCHSVQPASVEANGAKHKTFPCQDCHAGHRPTSKNNIPVCSQCHAGKPHFDQKVVCLSCHRDPHTPLKITFTDKLTAPCLTCHTAQNKQLTENKSKHSALYCTTCHGVHRVKPACTQCHKPHSADITAADCTKCHKAHMPKVVTYAADVPSKFCAACHKNQFALLTASKALHSKQSCAFCHQEKHKMVPNCKDCHGAKHPEGIMAKFPKCLECHKHPHDLNNWTNTVAPKAAAPKAKQKKH